jgi:hypothetical protein
VIVCGSVWYRLVIIHFGCLDESSRRTSTAQHSTFPSPALKLTKMADNEAHRQPGTSEEEPLLGRRGDASQQEGLPLYQNLVIGK